MLKSRSTRAPKKAPVKSRRVAVPRLEANGIVTLNAADSRKLLDMLSQPAREPTEEMKAAIAHYRQSIQA
jgi:uncharacterized protein (DUF1778 family)